MSRFDAALVDLNTSVVDVFGDPIQVRRGTFETTLDGIFYSITDSYAAVLPLEQARFSAEFDSAEFAATGAGHGDTLIHAGSTYRIVDVVDVDGGIARVLLGAPGVNLN